MNKEWVEEVSSRYFGDLHRQLLISLRKELRGKLDEIVTIFAVKGYEIMLDDIFEKLVEDNIDQLYAIADTIPNNPRRPKSHLHRVPLQEMDPFLVSNCLLSRFDKLVGIQMTLNDEH
jgi:hypothetical protein